MAAAGAETPLKIRLVAARAISTYARNSAARAKTAYESALAAKGKREAANFDLNDESALKEEEEIDTLRIKAGRQQYDAERAATELHKLEDEAKSAATAANAATAATASSPASGGRRKSRRSKRSKRSHRKSKRRHH
jgi:hypothetical protein